MRYPTAFAHLSSSLVIVCALGCNQAVPTTTAPAPTDSEPGKADEGVTAKQGNHSEENPVAAPIVSKDDGTVRPELKTLFEWVDSNGREITAKTRFIRANFSLPDASERPISINAWLVREDSKQVGLLENDLIPQVYERDAATTVPASWRPSELKLESIADADFEGYCRELVAPPKESLGQEDEAAAMAASMYGPGPSYRLLIAHAAWKADLSDYCEPLIAADLQKAGDFAAYSDAVREDLAWLHFLRGVNLLMFANRKEAIQHLNLVTMVAPNSKFASQAKELIPRLERQVAGDGQDTNPGEPAAKVSEAQRLVAELKNTHCQQFSQPGGISPYMVIVNGAPDENAPTKKLLDLGMDAVPSLIDALSDDSPTRTVYHWRDFDHNRVVWRVSDFAWSILQDVAQREFGAQRIVGFTFGSMSPEERKATIAEVQKWYDENKDLSPEERMFGHFSSANPNDWVIAGEYFAAAKNPRALAALLEKIPNAPDYMQADLSELAAKYGDVAAIPVIRKVLSAQSPSDRLSAAIALYELGDRSGIPLAIEFASADPQPSGSWSDPVWFLLHARDANGMAALQKIVESSSSERAAEVVRYIDESISGDLWSRRREPAGCIEVCPVLVAGFERAEDSSGSINGVTIRIKDAAATAFARLRQGTPGDSGSRFAEIDPSLFNQLEPDTGKRDLQIKEMSDWYSTNRENLVWNEKERKLEVAAETRQ